MTFPPWLALALLIALTLALMYQIGSRRFGLRLVAYWTAILAGLLVAEVLADSLGWNVTRLGDLRVAPDLAGAAMVMVSLWYLGI